MTRPTTLSPRRGVLTLAACCLLTGALAGQTQAAPDMAKPPAVGPVKAYQPPASHQDQLPNGLKIIVIEDHRFPLVSVRMALRAGTSRLSPQDAGLADAEADLLLSGTPTRTALQIAQEADSFGGGIGADAGPDFLTVSADSLSLHAADMLRLMADIVLRSNFPESEVELRKANMKQELEANRADPNFLAGVQFDKALFGTHPYAITAPTDASIARISREALVKFHNENFLPNNGATVVVSGDIDAARAHNLVQQYFGDWKFGPASPPPSPPVPEPATRRFDLINRPDSAQSTILLGNLGLTRLSPDYFPFLVVNEVLGGSFNSRLIADVREQKGYAYGISSGNEPYRDLGAWEVSTQVRTPVTADALNEIFAQLDKIRAAPVTPDELSQAKNYLSGNFVLGLQTQAEVAGQFLTTDIYGLPADRLATWVGKVQAVDAEQAQAAAEKYIHPDRDLVVVVGDAKQLQAPLEKIAAGAPVHLYDDKGDPVPAAPAATPHH